MANALFVCLHNAGRSQMSRALFEAATEGRHGADAAGTEPAAELHPVVVEAMAEVGIDLTGRRPQLLTQEMAERAAAGRHSAEAAGTQPTERLHPAVVEAMAEIGIDLTGRRPRLLTREMAERADVVVTMGCGDECPYIPGKRYLDWDLPDPEDMPIEEVRELREEIAGRVEALVIELDGGAA